MSLRDMDRTYSRIVQAGREMFGRYGFAKTTISEIAEYAGVARQTVYNTFENKENVLRAVIRENGKEALAQLDAAWKKDETLEQKLATFQRVGPLSWFREVRAAPDWRGILENLNAIASKELAETDRNWVSKLDLMLKQQVRPTNGSPPEVSGIAEFFYQSSKNAKYGAENSEEMEARLETILEATLALMQSRGLDLCRAQ